MNDTNIAINTLLSCVSLLGLIYLVFWRFNLLWIDEFRQSMFAVRDDLFDYAASGKIAFDHPAYTTLRSMLNGYIRFSHKMSAVSFVLLVLYTAFSNPAYMPKLLSDTWAEAAADLDEETKNDLNHFREKAGSHVLHFMFLSSYLKKALLVLSLVGGAGLVVLYFRSRQTDEDLDVSAYRFTKESSPALSRSIDTLDTEAYVCGKEDYAFA